MAYWDNKQNRIIYYPTKIAPNYPGWEEMDCGCCTGLEWSREYPRECRTCKGSGVIYRHINSGALALYPGGHFVGHEGKVENERISSIR